MMLSSLRGRRALRRSSASRTLEPLEPRVLLSAGLIDLGRSVAADTAAGDQLGKSLASSGALVIVGSPFHDAAGVDSGAAYLFSRDGNALAERAKLTGGDAGAGDQFGLSVAIDGSFAVVGAPRHNVGGVNDTGAAYVFVHDGTDWLELAKLTAFDGAMGDQFGASVGVSGDTIVIGSNFDDDLGSSSGSVYVFNRDDGGTPGDLTDDVWSFDTKLLATGGVGGAQFGASVAIDGDAVAVGAPRTGNMAGTVYLFERAGGAWSQAAAVSGAPGDVLGVSVAIDGGVAAAGTSPQTVKPGEVHVITNATGSWTRAAIVTADDGLSRDGFGLGVDVDGDTLVVGASGPNANPATPGAAYVFANAGGVWTQTDKLTPADGVNGDQFGAAVTTSEGLFVVGSPMHDPVLPGSTLNQTSAGSIYGYGPDVPPPPPPPPGVPGAPDLVNTSDTGVSSTDNLTNDNTPSFAGTADANVTIEVFAGGVSLGTTTSDPTGAWLLTSGALGDGAHDITVVASNESGASGPSAALSIEIDTDAPAIIELALGDDKHGVVIHVSGLLDQMLAENGAHYKLIAANGDANGDGDPFNDGDEWQLSVGAVEYDAAAGVIRVPTLEFIDGDQFRLTVDGDDAASDGTPGLADAAGNGLAGGDFAALFNLHHSTPQDVVDDLTDTVADLDLKGNKQQQLQDALNDAMAHLESGGKNAVKHAVKDLESFIKKVNQCIGKGIDSETGQALIDGAQSLIDMILAGQ